ncbi:type VII secretion integral membrane protein EccD [Arthrobacter halodurans]|uniref:Type VII secretion integral membrane protein EccD n=1 Tax=Arthrobacter halodurans TaxID=516699 RepID=A0ABV4UPT5_9MICC
MSQPYTRVTLMGAQRHVDLLLPSAAEVGTLMPQILDLLGDRPGERVASKILLTATGEHLSPQDTLADAGVLDGAQLTLLGSHDAPPPAVVYDIADTVVDTSAEVGGRWTRHHLVAASGVFSVAGLLLGLELILGHSLPEQRWWAHLAIGAGALALGAAVAAAARPLGTTLMASGLGAVLLGLFHWDSPDAPRMLLAALAVAAFCACLAAGSRRPRSLLTAAAVAGALTGCWAIAMPLAAWAASGGATGGASGGSAGVGGFAAICAVLALGLLPSVALSASGLATLDDRRAAGASLRRGDALAAIRAAHGGLTLSTVAAAASAGAGMWLVGSDGDRTAWSLPLLLALVLATMLRARAFPMALERCALYAAAAAGVLAGAVTLAGLAGDRVWIVGVGVLLVSVLIGLGLAVDLPDHTEARLRQIAERVEVLAILATVPLLTGYFGVFAKMLETF